MPTVPDKESNLKDEESINFRPSPNFKHMKKYLKSKFEEANNATSDERHQLKKVSKAEAPGRAMDSKNPAPPPEDMPASESKPSTSKVETKLKVAAAGQPPLPPNTPPPDSPPLLTPKQEIEDTEYQCNSSSDQTPTQELITEYKTDQSEVTEKPEVIMCRNYIRGTCKKGAACIFAHKVIISQLPGVYTFCRNFQNSVCTFPKCKFVHATVFEKENFYRTAYLPPHTLSHLKDNNVPSQPPPPPPPPEEAPVEVAPPVFTNPPPPPPVQLNVNPTILSTCAATPVDRNAVDLFRSSIPTHSSPKREWSDSDEFSCSPRDIDASEPLAKKCKNCDSNEFRFQYSKNKVEKIIRVTDELEQKIKSLNKKHQRLYNVLFTLFKPSKASGGAGLHASLNISGEKEKAILEQINLLLAGTNRMPTLVEENKNTVNSLNLNNILAKLLRSSAEAPLSSDTFQYSKNKVEKIIRVTDELEQKIKSLNKKHQRLYNVLFTLFKPSKASGGAGLHASLNISGEKEKAILEQINLLLAGTNRMPTLVEENKNTVNSLNLNNILAKLLRSSAEAPLSSDTS